MDERKRNGSSTPLAEVIDKLMKADRLDHKLKTYDIIAAWPEMMGIAVANRTREIRIVNKMMYLTMDSSVMREELMNGKQIIIHRVNEKVGYEMITDIWFG